jgi:hypothetical protein
MLVNQFDIRQDFNVIVRKEVMYVKSGSEYYLIMAIQRSRWRSVLEFGRTSSQNWVGSSQSWT